MATPPVREVRQLLRQHHLPTTGNATQVVSRARKHGLLGDDPEDNPEPSVKDQDASSSSSKGRNPRKRARKSKRSKADALDAESKDDDHAPSEHASDPNRAFPSPAAADRCAEKHRLSDGSCCSPPVGDRRRTTLSRKAPPKVKSNLSLTWKKFGAHEFVHNLEKEVVGGGDEQERSDEDYELDIAGLRYGHDFLFSCHVGDCEHIEELVEDSGINVDFTDHNGWSGIHWACWEGRVDAVKTLIDLGADVNLADKTGARPLHRAASCGFPDAVSALLRAGARPSAADVYGNLAVHSAASWEDCQIVRILVEAGSPVGDRSQTFNSVFYYTGQCARMRPYVKSGLLARRRHLELLLTNHTPIYVPLELVETILRFMCFAVPNLENYHDAPLELES